MCPVPNVLTLELLGRPLGIVRPRLYFGNVPGSEKDDFFLAGCTPESGFVQQFTALLPAGCRHISTAEMVAFIQKGIAGTRDEKQVFAEVLLAYLLKRGLDADDVYRQRHSIYLSDGLRLEGYDLVIFKRLDGKIERVADGGGYEVTVGHRLIVPEETVEHARFSMERLFRLFNPDSFTVRDLEKSNLDAFQYLFGVEGYEDLPTPIQRAYVELPPQFVGPTRYSERDLEINISLLSVDLGFSMTPDRSSSTVQRISHLTWHGTTLGVEQISCGTHLLVQDISQETLAVPILAAEPTTC